MTNDHATQHLFPQKQAFPSARLTSDQSAKILGFQPHDIPILISKKLLTPLGKPKENSAKYFSWQTILSCSNDERWLSKATQAVYEHWKGKNARKRMSDLNLQ